MDRNSSRKGADCTVDVWDLPTRLFHWILVALVLIAWLTGEEEGGAFIHRLAGFGVAGLLVFRVVWGFVGGEHARFADFAAGPSAIAAHVSNLFLKHPVQHLGHNPLGGVFVFLLLISLAIVVATGLFSDGEHNAGPFAGLWGLQLSDAHEVAFRTLQGLVAIHIAGVVFETWKTRDALVRAMITGRKTRRAGGLSQHARRAGFGALLAAAGLGLAVFLVLTALPPAGR